MGESTEVVEEVRRSIEGDDVLSEGCEEVVVSSSSRSGDSSVVGVGMVRVRERWSECVRAMRVGWSARTEEGILVSCMRGLDKGAMEWITEGAGASWVMACSSGGEEDGSVVPETLEATIGAVPGWV